MKNDIKNRADIEKLIDAFYEKVAKDIYIGYFFNDVAQVDWEHHLPQMYNFWESLLFGKKLYSGNPMRKHLDLHQQSKMTVAQFDHWLKLFYSTIDELFVGENCIRLKDYAKTIKENLSNRVVLSIAPNQIINF